MPACRPMRAMRSRSAFIKGRELGRRLGLRHDALFSQQFPHFGRLHRFYDLRVQPSR
jgi:hypothetical protein